MLVAHHLKRPMTQEQVVGQGKRFIWKASKLKEEEVRVNKDHLS
jgi:hypothetical protein